MHRKALVINIEKLGARDSSSSFCSCHTVTMVRWCSLPQTTERRRSGTPARRLHSDALRDCRRLHVTVWCRCQLLSTSFGCICVRRQDAERSKTIVKPSYFSDSLLTHFLKFSSVKRSVTWVSCAPTTRKSKQHTAPGTGLTQQYAPRLHPPLLGTSLETLQQEGRAHTGGRPKAPPNNVDMCV